MERCRADLPRDFRGTDMLASDFWSNASERLTGWWRAAFAAMILALIAIYVAAPASRAASSRMSRRSRTRHVFAGARGALDRHGRCRRADASVTLFFALFNGFDLIGGPARTAGARNHHRRHSHCACRRLARALLQPSRSHWRLVDVNNSVAERLSRLAISVAAIVSVTRILEALWAVVGATLPVSVLTRGLGALFVAVAMAVALYRIFREPEDANEYLGPRVVTRRDWSAPLRFAAWGAILVVIASVAVGYIALAAFVVDQIVWVACVGSLSTSCSRSCRK